MSWTGPALLLLVVCLAFLCFLSYSASELPERVATHFGLSGEPDDWMSRSGAIAFTGAMGLGLPLFIVGLAALIRFLPARVVNIPNREYWLAPERRARTSDLIFRQMLWLASLLVCFLAGVHYLTIRANSAVPARMPANLFLIMLIGFLAAMGVWAFCLVRTFSKPGEPAHPSTAATRFR